MTKTEKATQWMEATARNDAHGYDQTFVGTKRRL